MPFLFAGRAVAVFSIALALAGWLRAANPFPLSAEHEQAVRRGRRILVQLDAADHRRLPLEPEAWLRYMFTFPDEPGSQIDTILLDVGLDSESAVYPSDWLPLTPDRRIREWNARGFEWVGALVRECHRRKIEVIWNHRFSEVDLNAEGGLEMQTLHPLKAQHPDWLVRCWWWQGLWNAASPGLRDFKVRQLRELAEKYEFDGFQVDFARHIPVLPQGHQWEQREQVTEFLRMLRAMLLETEHRKGRPLLLGARVPRNLEGCRADGFDVWTWGRERLVDQLTLGSRSFEVDVEGYRKAAGERVRLYPCYDDHHASDGYRFAPIEYMRGVFANWWKQGANGVMTFNFAVAPPEEAERAGDALAPATHAEAYRQVGSLETMAFRDKVYVVERRGGYPWAEGFFNRNDTASLPAPVPNDGRPLGVRVRIADNPQGLKSIALRLVLFGALGADVVSVDLNGVALSNARINEEWKDPQIFSPRPQPNSGGSGKYTVNPAQRLRLVTYAVSPAVAREGWNDVQMRVAHRGPYPPGAAIQVEKVEVEGRY